MASVLDMCCRSRLHTLTEAFLFWLPGNRENETPTSANVIKLDGCLRKRTQGGSEIKEGESTKRKCNEMRQSHLYSYKLDLNESLTFLGNEAQINWGDWCCFNTFPCFPAFMLSWHQWIQLHVYSHDSGIDDLILCDSWQTLCLLRMLVAALSSGHAVRRCFHRVHREIWNWSEVGCALC